jgi:hypothetical protein
MPWSQPEHRPHIFLPNWIAQHRQSQVRDFQAAQEIHWPHFGKNPQVREQNCRGRVEHWGYSSGKDIPII